MAKGKDVELIDINIDRFYEVLRRIQPLLAPEDFSLLERLLETVCYLLELIQQKSISIGKLRRIIFGDKTEKLSKLSKSNRVECSKPSRGSSDKANSASRSKAKRRGRNGLEDYPGAKRIEVPHQHLKPGDQCPCCAEARGKLYDTGRPTKSIRIMAHPLFSARGFECQQLRCSSCGQVFTADLLEEAGEGKYDDNVGPMLGLLRYGSGLPFNRIESLQKGFGVPFPAATQWQLVSDTAQNIRPAYDHLLTLAAQTPLVHNDDTNMRVLELLKSSEPPPQEETPATGPATKPRKGVFTTGIVSYFANHPIALFFTGRSYAGENLNALLKQRAPDLDPPQHMCDGLNRNAPADFELKEANCNSHGRRQFVDIWNHFPEQCQFVVEQISAVYRNEILTKQRDMSAPERLAFHQEHSQPIMDNLHEWMRKQIDHKKVEPNSALGKAIKYMLKRWKKLTLFLREPGAPIDNNIAERILKVPILHRKNSLFYRTERGGHVGDLFMSLIQTCRLNGVDPFDYLTQLNRHQRQVTENPDQWMPWNYRQNLSGHDTS